MQLEFFPRDGVPQFAFGRPLRMRDFQHCRVIDAEIIPAVGFGIIEREVGALQELLRLDAVFRRQRNPDAGADAGLMAVEIEGPANGVDDPQRERDRAFMLGRPSLLDDCKLVAAEARQHVGLANGGLQTPAHLDQQLIAGGMAKRVIDGLELVEIEHHDGDGVIVPLQALARFLELRIEFGPVRKSRQRVVAREVDDLRLRPSPLGDVFVRCQPPAVSHRLAGDQDEAPVGKFVNPARSGILRELVQ